MGIKYLNPDGEEPPKRARSTKKGSAEGAAGAGSEGGAGAGAGAGVRADTILSALSSSAGAAGTQMRC